MSILFEQLKVGDRFRVSGGLETYLRHPRTKIDDRVVNAEYLSGPYKNEFIYLCGETKVKKVQPPRVVVH